MGNCLCLESILSDSPIKQKISQKYQIETWLDAWDIVKEEELKKVIPKVH